MKPTANPPVHEASRFHWRGNKGSAEASDLGRGRVSGQIWNDSADVGFVCCSPRTGKEIVFTLTKVDEKDGEIRAWEFESHAVNPKLKVVIFND